MGLKPYKMRSYDWNLFYGLLAISLIPDIITEFGDVLPAIAVSLLLILNKAAVVIVAFMRDPIKREENPYHDSVGVVADIPASPDGVRDGNRDRHHPADGPTI